MIREASIILPATMKRDDDALAMVLRSATAAFGGATVTRGNGAWRNGAGLVVNEPVAIVTIAMSGTEQNEDWLRGLAHDVRGFCDQEAVYIRFASGAVELVTS